MKRIIKIIGVILGVCAAVGFVVISIMNICPGTQYGTYEAATYFDKKGEYQLLDVADAYFLYDAKNKKTIGSFIQYYIQIDEKVYLITNPSELGINYAILDTYNETFIEKADLNYFNEEEKKIFENTDDMVDLTKKRNEDLKRLMELIPQKWRKW